MTQSSRPRKTSPIVQAKAGCVPLKEAYAHAVEARPTSWEQVEGLFLKGMESFDANVASGLADMGDLQNGKGDFFNDLIALLLENCAGVNLYSRGSVPGLIIPKHNLDVTFPKKGTIEFILEAKALGTPKHPGSPKEKAIGRGGAADIDKRVKEIGFKTIDLKAEYARILSQSGTGPTPMGGDLTAWLRSVKPRAYVFFAARVISQSDRERLIAIADQAGLVNDGVGVFCFGPVSEATPTTYRAEPVPAQLQIARVLFRACQDLTSIKQARPDDI